MTGDPETAQIKKHRVVTPKRTKPETQVVETLPLHIAHHQNNWQKQALQRTEDRV